MKISLVACAAIAVLLGGCSDAETPAVATDTGSSTPTPTLSPRPSTPASSPVESPSSDPSPAETADPGGSPAQLESAQLDVETIAVSLEGFYRGNPYPQTVEDVIDTLADAGLTLTPGNSIGSYVYDPDAVEFKLCVQTEGGSWATYDTAPMTLRESGLDGGCP